MKETKYINMVAYESDNKSDLSAICRIYGINEDRIYWDNFRFFLDIFNNEIK